MGRRSFVATAVRPRLAGLLTAWCSALAGPACEALPGSLQEHPQDPWGNEYVYKIVGGKVTVTCLGSDGVEGGEGEASDLTLFKEDEP